MPRPTPSRPLSTAGAVAAALVLLGLLLSTGCAPLQLPRIDPTGERFFLPYPEASTQLTLPRPHGESGFLPRPAFTTPPPPPPCLQGPTAAPGVLPPLPGAAPAPPTRPVAPDDCAHGPPAVLLGSKHHDTYQPHPHHHGLHGLLHLPEQGKRGRILLSPRRIIAPVGGEVLLRSGICGTDGYLMTGEPLEWMLAPEGVGNFVQVGDEDRSRLLRLASSAEREKVTGQFARGVTSTRPALVTRGNLSRRDDVSVKKGEGWITLSSASEGVSRVTVLAPESECWDHRKATATIYWIDASWRFPEPQVVPAGTPATLVTQVMRSEATIPAEGWLVRYEILTPTLGGFGADRRSVEEVPVDGDGRAAVEVVPTPGSRGTATVEVQVIRPAEADLPRMTLARGETTITWSAPDLQMQASAPQIATFDQPVPIRVALSNPGDLDAENVQLSGRIPPGVRVVSAEVGGQPLEYTTAGDQVRIDIGRLPARRQMDIEVVVTARERFRLPLTARADGGLIANAEVDVEVFEPSLDVRVVPVDSSGTEVDRAQIGDQVTFNIDVTNTGNRALRDVRLEAAGETGLRHESGQGVLNRERPEPLDPGETWRVGVTYAIEQAGRQCVRITARAAGGQQAEADACVTGTNPPPPTPSLNARVAAVPEVDRGERFYGLFYVQNDGRVPVTDARVVATYDALLEPHEATADMSEGADRDRYQVRWRIPRLEPGQQVLFEINFEAVGTGESDLYLTVETDEGARASAEGRVRVRAAAPASPRDPAPRTPGDGPQAPRLPDEDGRDAPPLGAARGALRLYLFDRRDPAIVGEEIPYDLTIENDRGVEDSAVRVRLQLPPGVELVRANPVGFPGAGEVQFPEEGVAELPEVRSIRAGETIDYAIVLRANQPQTLRIAVEATSRLTPEGVTAREETDVRPR